jgi:hypothetical protein
MLALLSNDYYLLIPKSTDSTYGIKPLSTRRILGEEESRLSNLKYFNYTANVLMAAQHRNDEMNPLDYVHKSLDCDIQELSPETGHEELHNAISKYMQETGAGPSGEHYDLLHLFSVDRKGEAARYQPFATNENRMLLWHGSKISNFIGILKQGLRIKPGQAYETVCNRYYHVNVAFSFANSNLRAPCSDQACILPTCSRNLLVTAMTTQALMLSHIV